MNNLERNINKLEDLDSLCLEQIFQFLTLDDLEKLSNVYFMNERIQMYIRNHVLKRFGNGTNIFQLVRRNKIVDKHFCTDCEKKDKTYDEYNWKQNMFSREGRLYGYYHEHICDGCSLLLCFDHYHRCDVCEETFCKVCYYYHTSKEFESSQLNQMTFNTPIRCLLK